MATDLGSHFSPDIWAINRPDDIASPQLIVFQDQLMRNLQLTVQLAGQPGVERLRPHCKTHKMPAVIQRQLALGITRHKSATFAEAEMLANAGVQDIVLAYNIVGPNIARAVRFRQRFPHVKFMVTADATGPLLQLAAAMTAVGESIGVLLDLNPGRDRTGLPVGAAARSLYQLIAETPGVAPAGFHLYDGHYHQPDLAERMEAVLPEWNRVCELRDELVATGFEVPRIICGGTPTFPVYSQFDDPAIELSPGTCTFHDIGYHEKYADLRMFQPAALVLTRVVSRPTANRVTFDMGTKAIASDPPMGQRACFPAIPDGVQVLHNEEHLVIETDLADRFQPGDWALAIPRHVCPTSALYREAVVVSNGDIVDRWPVVARDRQITI